VGVEEKAVTVGGLHLSNCIFVEHSFIESKLAGDYLVVDFVIEQLIFVKGMADEQAGVAHVAFYIRI